MKSIGLSKAVYLKLQNVKHGFESEEGRSISFNDTVDKLIDKNNGKNCTKNHKLAV